MAVNSVVVDTISCC